MHEVDLPVSLIDSQWLREKVLRGLPSDGGVVWLVVEHPNEGDVIIGRLEQEMYRRGPCTVVDVHEDDPALLWSDLVDATESIGHLWSVEPGGRVLIRGGANVHADLLDRWAKPLARITRATPFVCLFPIHKVTAETGGDFLASGTQLRVPPLESFGKAPLLAAAHQIFSERAGELGVTMEPVIVDSLVGLRPQSRTELEFWIDALCRAVAEGDRDIAPEGIVLQRRVHGHPRRPALRSELRAQFGRILSKLEESSALFTDWRGVPLFYDVRALARPFDSEDTRSNYLTAISYAACQCFDARDPALTELVNLDVEDGDVRFAAAPPFYNSLRALRTRFQHALDWSRPKDVEKREVVAGWMKSACGVAEPQRHHWRKLCSCLLREWEEATDRLLAVLKHVRQCANRRGVEEKVQRAQRALADHLWEDVARTAAADLAVDVDVGEFVRRARDRLASALRDSLCTADAVRSVARGLAERELLALPRAPLLLASELMVAGVPQTRLRDAMKRAEVLVNEKPTVRKEDVLEALRGEFGSGSE